MECTVVPLRRRGRRLKRSELAHPVLGQLRVIDWPLPNGLNRCTRKAEIRTIVAGSLSHDLLCPIFDPVMIRVDESGMYLSGWEISTAAGETSDHAQVWWLRFHALTDAHP
jgi:hypothetical protein